MNCSCKHCEGKGKDQLQAPLDFSLRSLFPTYPALMMPFLSFWAFYNVWLFPLVLLPAEGSEKKGGGENRESPPLGQNSV